MNFANFFIKRPIFATVLAIILTLMGVVSMRVLPIEQYPSVVPPTVAVTAQFPGADAETVDIIDVEEVPLAYLPGNATRIRIRAAGNLSMSAGELARQH